IPWSRFRWFALTNSIKTLCGPSVWGSLIDCSLPPIVSTAPGSISGVALSRRSFPSRIGTVGSSFDEGDELLLPPAIEGRAHAVRGALVALERRVLDQL